MEGYSRPVLVYKKAGALNQDTPRPIKTEGSPGSSKIITPEKPGPMGQDYLQFSVLK